MSVDYLFIYMDFFYYTAPQHIIWLTGHLSVSVVTGFRDCKVAQNAKSSLSSQVCDIYFLFSKKLNYMTY